MNAIKESFMPTPCYKEVKVLKFISKIHAKALSLAEFNQVYIYYNGKEWKTFNPDYE